MDFASLPCWALPLPGESRASWLAATGRRVPFLPLQWTQMVCADPLEPERPLVGAPAWTNLPPELGNLSAVPSLWRLAPERRAVYCVRCHVHQAGQRRWPTRVPWLDARRVACDVHPKLLLEHRLPETVGRAALIWVNRCDPEIGAWLAWLSEWMAMAPHSREALWRGDLAVLVARNWLPWGSERSAAATIDPTLRSLGVSLPGCKWYQGPACPVRLGQLPPAARLAALFASYRYTRLFDGAMDARVPPVAAQGWQWLARRWRDRAPPHRAVTLAWLWQRHGSGNGGVREALG